MLWVILWKLLTYFQVNVGNLKKGFLLAPTVSSSWNRCGRRVWLLNSHHLSGRLAPPSLDPGWLICPLTLWHPCWFLLAFWMLGFAHPKNWALLWQVRKSMSISIFIYFSFIFLKGAARWCGASFFSPPHRWPLAVKLRRRLTVPGEIIIARARGIIKPLRPGSTILGWRI